MNEIPRLQNEDAQQARLKARWVVYADAKKLLISQLVLTVAVPVAGAIAGLWFPSIRPAVALLALGIALFDTVVLDRCYRRLLGTAAKIQEEFDCTVLGLPWDKLFAGKPVDPEAVHGYESRYKRSTPLTNWYPVAVAELPVHLARIICQRTNLWYDSTLRRLYSHIVIGVVAVLGMALIVYGFACSLTIEEFVIFAAAPVAPVTNWAVREWFRQRDAADALDSTRAEAEALWTMAVNGRCTPNECSAQSRHLQGAIYLRRANSPLIFDWLYKIMRPKLERQMDKGAEHWIEEARAHSAF